LAHAAAVAGDPPGGSDADLLARFAGGRDEAAFAELVRRHGRLVWAVCRNLLPNDADADDAFQATFLALVRSAGRVRGGSVAPFLYGVAHKVAGKARLAAARRARRERAAATADADRAVPESAWDAVMAAVHAEVARLPESLRTPFVLCCLEGKPVTAAAAELGWKLGTLSGRLTRAKQTLLDRLAKRGVPAAAAGAAVLAGGAATAAVPAAVTGRAAGLAAGGAAPIPIRTLAEGVTGMGVMRTKLLAAAVLVAGGLAAGVGGLGTADAQDTGKKPAVTPRQTADDLARTLDALAADQEKLRAQLAAQEANRRQAEADRERALAELKRVEADVEAARRNADGKKAEAAKPASRWEYDFLTLDRLMTPLDYVKLFREREADGWEFAGTVPVSILMTADRKPVPSPLGVKNFGDPVLVFKRPAKAVVAEAERLHGELFRAWQARPLVPTADAERLRYAEAITQAQRAKAAEAEVMAGRAAGQDAKLAGVRSAVAATMQRNPGARFAPTLEAVLNANPDPGVRSAVETHGRTVLEAEVMTVLRKAAEERVVELQRQIETLRTEAMRSRGMARGEPQSGVAAVLPRDPNGPPPEVIAAGLKAEASKRFPADGPDGGLSVIWNDTTWELHGQPAVVEWATGVVRKLGAKPGPMKP
jgi:RNA polymerase sigma factor (sigma-70 family)